MRSLVVALRLDCVHVPTTWVIVPPLATYDTRQVRALCLTSTITCVNDQGPAALISDGNPALLRMP
jgi:hypothetical protein